MEDLSKSEERVRLYEIFKTMTFRYTPPSSKMSNTCLKNQFSCSRHSSGIKKPLTTNQNLRVHGAPPRPNTESSTGTNSITSIPYLRTQAPTLDAYTLRQVPTNISFLLHQLKRTRTLKKIKVCLWRCTVYVQQILRKWRLIEAPPHKEKRKLSVHPQSGT